MKILFYSIYANFLPPFGTLLELIKKEQENGNEVFVVRCKGAFTSCHANLKHNPIKCARCVERSDYAFELLGIPKKNIFDIVNTTESKQFEVPVFNSTDELLNFGYNGYQIGRGVASTIISRSRDLELSSTKYGELIELYLRMAIDSLSSLSQIIEKIKPDATYVYNGRQPEDRPLILLCEKLKIDYNSYVSGSNGKKYRLFKNGVVHYLKSVQNDVDTLLLSGVQNGIDIDKEGGDWFNSIFSNANKNLPDFTKSQVKGKLPEQFNTNQLNIAIYNSSEDEMKTFDDWRNPLYNNQNEAIKEICRSFLPYQNVQFYLRIHPNLSGVNNLQMKEIKAMDFPNLVVINADSDISTYGLMDACDKIITFGSSTGPEATHRGKPSILLGKSFYDHLDCVYIPKNYDELIELVLDKELKAKPAFNARKFGYYLANHGVDHNELIFKDQFHFFKNKKLEQIRPRLIFYIFEYLILHFKQWRITKKLIEKYGF
jgi:hypothetical protein